MTSPLKSLKFRIKATARKLDDIAARVGSRSRFLASAYYLARGSFSREHQAVLAGRTTYHRSLSDPSINTSMLRRNVHRVEKGLLMKPRRVPFGLGYIEETVAAYQRAVLAGTEINELVWARDVLDEYMRITPPEPRIEKLRTIVEEMRGRVDSRVLQHQEEQTPYHRQASDAPTIEVDEFLKLAQFRRSVRWYLPRKVPREAVAKAIQAAGLSPTACNRMPYRFRVFDDPEIVKEVIQLPMGTTGFHQQVPAVAVIVGRQRNYSSERDRHLIYVDGALAAMSFVYALEVQGIGSCCINWPDIEEREKRMASLLKLDADERPIMLVSFGYPDPEGLVARSTKKPTPSICQFNFE